MHCQWVSVGVLLDDRFWQTMFGV